MSLPLLAGAVLVILGLGYRFYGGFVARQMRLDPSIATPANRLSDGVDFVPTRPFYLLGQHFSAIAAAGPIVGPIAAGMQFGWLPALLWIVLGVIFIGAVHDMSTLLASVRHDGRSIAEVVRTHLGPGAGVAMMAFIWIALIYVIVAFTSATASTFVSGDADTAGLEFRFNPGGAVALAAILYLLLAVVMGVVEKIFHPPLWLQTAVFVPLTLVCVWAGTRFSTVLILDARTWSVLILAYCFAASLTPVWALLQPRGYLGGFVLYMALIVGVVGVFFGGFTVTLPAFRGFSVPGPTGMLFPYLFVTIACGACSGFHGLVCSGTTSKQIASEAHCHPVGYGAMLLEGVVAVLALGTILIALPADLKGLAPGAIYSQGLGRFLAVIIGKEHLAFAVTFGAMAFSTFVFDTLDVSTRLGRYILEELFSLRSRTASVAATLLTCAIPLVFVLLSGKNAWLLFWTLFGTSNQLLAALSLLGVSVWLKKIGRRYWYTLAPGIFVAAVTVTSLVLQIRDGFFGGTATQAVNGVVGVLLLALASALFAFAGRALLARPAPATLQGT